MFQAKMIADSITDSNIRLATMELTYPLIVHNEFLTHRSLGRSDEKEYEEWLEFSRNSSSNRAIPSSKIIKAVLDDPYIPLKFRYSSKDMVPGDVMPEEEQIKQRNRWIQASYEMIKKVQEFDDDKVHKQWRNRLLGPWQWITVVATANAEHWRHFFNLRNHPSAQDEIHHIAEMAYNEYMVSTPVLCIAELYEWHLPYITTEDWSRGITIEDAKKISVSRCARASYLRQGESFSLEEDIKLYTRLTQSEPPHSSPLEHVAQATMSTVRSGNFVGWHQYRKLERL